MRVVIILLYQISFLTFNSRVSDPEATSSF